MNAVRARASFQISKPPMNADKPMVWGWFFDSNVALNEFGNKDSKIIHFLESACIGVHRRLKSLAFRD
jgi:hypothetical protein